MATKKTAPKSTGSSTSNKRSLADMWDDTDPSEASNSLPPGEQEVRINKMELKDDPKKGKAVFVEYESIEGDNEGRKARQLYKLTDADGGKAPGLAYLMRDLALLGYEKIEGKKLPKVLKEITEEQPMVIVTAKENGQYINVYLQGLVDDATTGSDDDDDEDDDSEDDDSEEEKSFKVGDTVTNEDDEEGEVVAVNTKKETADVKIGKKTHKGIPWDDLTAADDEEEEEEEEGEEEEEEEEEFVAEVGSEVKFTNEDGDEIEGKVTKINTKKGTAVVTDEDDDEHKVALEDLEEA